MLTHSGMLKRFAGCITAVRAFSVRTAGSGYGWCSQMPPGRISPAAASVEQANMPKDWKNSYMRPDEGVPSICDLSCKEYFKIFWAIKRYVFNAETGKKSLSGLWSIDGKCGSNSSRKCFQERVARTDQNHQTDLQ